MIFLISLFLVYIIYWNTFGLYTDIIIFSIISLQCFQSAVVVHNCAHAHPFKESSHNTIFFLILTLLSGAPVSLYVPGHNQAHHRHLETERDATCTNKMKYNNDFLNFVLYVPTIVPRVILNEQRYMMRQYSKGAGIYHQYKKEVFAYYCFLSLLLFLNPKKALFVYILPTLVGKFYILSLNMLQHYKCNPESKFNHSRNFTGPILNFLFMNNGYHTVHHNAPGLHWSKLPAKHLEIIDKIDSDLIHENILQYTYNTHFNLSRVCSNLWVHSCVFVINIVILYSINLVRLGG